MMDDDDVIYEEDDDDQPSDATLLFAEEINKQFKKEFPLKAETEKKRQTAAFRRHAPSMARKLDFDMTLSPVPAMKAEVASARTAQSSAERQLIALRQEHEKLKQLLKRKDDKLMEKISELESSREKILELQEQNANLRFDQEATVAECNKEIELWASFGKKYYIWYSMASAQLDTVKLYVDSDGKFDDIEEVARLNQAPRQMLRTLENFEFDDETIEKLAPGSVQEYDGVEFSLRRTVYPERERETARADASIANFTLPQSSQTILDDSNSTLMDQTMMTDGCVANRSLIDYEKDEKIQRLLLENSVLKDRLNVSVGRAEKTLVMEEKNRTLEVEKNALQKKLDSTFNEIEAMRIGQANQLFKINEKVSTETDNSAKQLQLIDRINKLILKNNQLEKDFEAATSRMTKIMRESADCEKRNERLEDAFSTENEKRQELEAEKKHLKEQLDANKEKVDWLENQIEKLQTELQEALEKTVTEAPLVAAPTDAGNSTQIFHMASNPLQAAHAEFQAAESRKRKLTDSQESDTTAKHFREDQIAELEERIDICERERKVLEDSYNLHKDLASKFRQVCVALTGLQIKLKDADEGICTVQSEYEAGSARQFVFKYFYGTPRIDMLDVNCESSSEMIRKWEPLMKKYIGERNSIPAFLAAMTLQMEQSRDFDETMHERTHTFSVLHED